MNSIKKNISRLVIISFFIATPLFITHADNIIPTGDCDPAAGKICNPLGSNGPTDIPTFIHNILIGAIKIGIPVVALAIIYCGFLFVTARGNPDALKKAKDALLYTLIGAAILLGAWAIANLIVDVIGNLG